MTRVKTCVEDLVSELYGGFEPRDLRILLHLSEHVTEMSPGACTAIALQYPVSAKAETPEDAVREVMMDLHNYLDTCRKSKTFAPCWRDLVHQVAFDYGEPVDVDLAHVIDVRISQSLNRLLYPNGKITLEDTLRMRDVRILQKHADSATLYELFSDAA